MSVTSISPIAENEQSVHRKLNIESMDNDIELVWVDARIDTDTDCIQIKSRLRLIANRLRTFTKIDTCLEYINSRSEMDDSTFMCLITSGLYSSKILQAVQEIPQVQSVAIYCFDESCYESITDKKLLGVFTCIDTLLVTLNKSVKQLRDALLSISIFTIDGNERQQSFKELSKENAKFIWFQLLIELLLRLPRTDKARQTMINECERLYKDNSAQLAIVDDFKNTYQPKDAAKWYTRDSFLYRIINRALRSQSIDTILLFFPFIGDLHDQLIQLHTETLELGTSSLLTVYRSQSMHVNELNKIRANIGGVLSMNSFFSTSVERNVALAHIGNLLSAPSSSDIVFVVFTVLIDIEVPAVPFGSLFDHTYFTGENEFLFSVGALFRVETCDEIKDENDRKCSYWSVVIRLIDERAEQTLRSLFDYYMMLLTSSNCTSIEKLGYILFKMGDLDSAERFNMLLYNELDLEPQRKAIVYNNIGLLACRDSGYSKALEFYQKALGILKSIEPVTIEISGLIATSLNNIATISHRLGDHDHALQKYHEVLNIQRNAFQQYDNELVIGTLINLGTMYHDRGRFNDALFYLNQALDVCTRILPEDHPMKANVFESMASVYDKLGNEAYALEGYKRAHDIRIRCLPLDHPSLASSHVNLAAMYIEYGNYILAKEHLDNAWTIDQKNKSRLDPIDMAHTLSGFATLYNAQRNYSEALLYYKRALELIPIEHLDSMETYKNIGTILGHMGEVEEALIAFEKARTHPAARNNELNLADVFHARGLLQCRNGQSFPALMSFQHALVIRYRYLPKIHPKIAKLYNEIGSVLLSKGSFSKALQNFRFTLDIEEKTLPHGHIEISRTLNNIAVTLYRLEEYPEALQYSRRAVNMAAKSLGLLDPLVISFTSTFVIILKKTQEK